MIDISLTSETKRNIEFSTGIPIAEIERLDAESIDKLIEKRIKKPLEIDPKIDPRLPRRGSIYLLLARYLKMLDIDKKLNAI